MERAVQIGRVSLQRSDNTGHSIRAPSAALSVTFGHGRANISPSSLAKNHVRKHFDRQGCEYLDQAQCTTTQRKKHLSQRGMPKNNNALHIFLYRSFSYKGKDGLDDELDIHHLCGGFSELESKKPGQTRGLWKHNLSHCRPQL